MKKNNKRPIAIIQGLLWLIGPFVLGVPLAYFVVIFFTFALIFLSLGLAIFAGAFGSMEILLHTIHAHPYITSIVFGLPLSCSKGITLLLYGCNKITLQDQKFYEDIIKFIFVVVYVVLLISQFTDPYSFICTMNGQSNITTSGPFC